MTSIRTLLMAISLLVSGGAYSQVHEVDRLWPTSVAVDEPAWAPFTMVLANEDGTPAVGVPFTWSTEWQCGTFEEGIQMSGVTDGNGRAVSSTYYGVAQDLGCKVWFNAANLSLRQIVRVFYPASVVMVPEREEIQTLTDFNYEVWIWMWDVDMGVAAGPPEVTSISSGASDATAFATGAYCHLNIGLCILGFQSNGRPGKYDIGLRYLDQTLVIPVKQLPNN